MTNNEQSANSAFPTGFGFQANGDARFVSQKVRDLVFNLKAKMSEQANSPKPFREGFAFEYLDGIDQQIDLGGKFEVDVLGVSTKNSPDIVIKNKVSGVTQEQCLKYGASKADQVAKRGDYGSQEIRTPKGQTQKPKNPKVNESNVSRSEVSKGANNPNQTANSYQFKAAMAEISNAAAMGAITGTIAATLISGLDHR